MGIGEAEAFSERLKRELQALEAANVHAILESEPLVDEVFPSYLQLYIWVQRYLFFVSMCFLLLSWFILVIRTCQRMGHRILSPNCTMWHVIIQPICIRCCRQAIICQGSNLLLYNRLKSCFNNIGTVSSSLPFKLYLISIGVPVVCHKNYLSSAVTVTFYLTLYLQSILSTIILY